eukprot:6831453-Lingulodinium_polyedra.AAC.1
MARAGAAHGPARKATPGRDMPPGPGGARCRRVLPEGVRASAGIARLPPHRPAWAQPGRYSHPRLRRSRT